jgi:Protein of unknown function (DUF3592)
MPQPSIRRMPVVLWIFLSLFILAGLGGVGAGCWNVYRGLRCESWPTTEGVVDRAAMTSHTSNKGGVTYSADISYHYQAAGTYHTGTRLAFGTMSSSYNYAQEILSRYPVGARVPVHYSPDDPELAVLETGVHKGVWIEFGVGTVFILVGTMFLQIVRKGIAAQNAPAPPDAVNPQKSPALLGVIFIVVGSFPLFLSASGGAPTSGGAPQWVGYAIGGMFISAGLYIMTSGLRNKIYSKILGAAVLLMFLAVFHWISFAPGERIGTASTPFSHSTGVNVKTYFAAATVVMDLVLLAGFARWLVKGRKG